MKESENELKEAIIIISKYLDQEERVKDLLKVIGIYSTIRELIYIMFIKYGNDHTIYDYTIFNAIQLIRRYCQEMSKNGNVGFNIPYSI